MSADTGSAALRCYIAYHPSARINLVTYKGRTVWMTQKQYAIWRVVLDYKMRGRWLSQAAIAEKAIVYGGGGVSVASVSRFLRKLDLWRFIDLITRSGRRGGTAILTRKSPSTTADREPWLAGARQTWASRKRARDLLFQRMRKRWEEMHLPPVMRPKSVVVAASGSTDAKYRQR